MENIIFDNMMVHYSGKDYFNKIKSMPIQVGIFNPDFVPDYFLDNTAYAANKFNVYSLMDRIISRTPVFKGQ